MSLIKYSNNILKKIIIVCPYSSNILINENMFGNFLNGSFCLLQICIQNHINFALDLSPLPISNCLKNSPISINNRLPIENINFPLSIINDKVNCYNYLITILNNINGEEVAVYFKHKPFYPIQDFGREYIKMYITPSQPIINDINNKLLNVQLSPLSYSILYINLGKKHIQYNINSFENDKIRYVKYIKENILNDNIIINNNRKYILLCNDNDLINQLQITNKNIFNLGNNNNRDESMLSFNLLYNIHLISKAENIVAIGCSEYDLTFCTICTDLYNIPLEIKYITNI